ncbi:MAG: DUF302 domain-containing protein [Steroidobacteraceae bacterium]|jgi:uncharacterized protein (DUF302 family)
MAFSESGVLDVLSHHSVVETIDRLESVAKAQGLLVFARIDFGGDARRAGLALRPMQMLLFGNPMAGTPLLSAAPRSGLDLPLKALAWEEDNGAVWLSYNAPEYLGARHSLPASLIANIAGIRNLVERAAGA